MKNESPQTCCTRLPALKLRVIVLPPLHSTKLSRKVVSSSFLPRHELEIIISTNLRCGRETSIAAAVFPLPLQNDLSITARIGQTPRTVETRHFKSSNISGAIRPCHLALLAVAVTSCKRPFEYRPIHKHHLACSAHDIKLEQAIISVAFTVDITAFPMPQIAPPFPFIE